MKKLNSCDLQNVCGGIGAISVATLVINSVYAGMAIANAYDIYSEQRSIVPFLQMAFDVGIKMTSWAGGLAAVGFVRDLWHIAAVGIGFTCYTAPEFKDLVHGTAHAVAGVFEGKSKCPA